MSRDDTILVVDNEPLLLAAIGRELDAEFRTILVQSYEEAVQLLETQTPWRAVVSDFDLGHRENGLALLRLAKKKLPASFRVLMSGSLTTDETEYTAAAGEVSAFIEKPWPPNALRDLLKTHVVRTM